MARSLNGFTLPINTQWTDELNYAPLRQAQRLTTGGGIVFAEQRLIGGRQITLEWAKGRAWLTWADVQNIQILLAAGENASFSFVWDTLALTVKLNHAAKAFEYEPLWGRIDKSSDKFFGSLKLITI